MIVRPSFLIGPLGGKRSDLRTGGGEVAQERSQVAQVSPTVIVQVAAARRVRGGTAEVLEQQRQVAQSDGSIVVEIEWARNGIFPEIVVPERVELRAAEEKNAFVRVVVSQRVAGAATDAGRANQRPGLAIPFPCFR